MRLRTIIGLSLAISLLTGVPPVTHAAESPDQGQQQEDTAAPTPPRLSFVDGQVSFWRPGAQEWVQAELNTPLAAGDQLYTGSPGNLELQIGARAFVRGWANTQIGLENEEPDFIQFRVTAGRASFDLRSLDPGHTVEVDTPNAAFTIEHPGYYRVNVVGDRTSFITRRAGRAIVTSTNGEAVAIAASEEVVVEGTDTPQVNSFVAPKLDEWDRWNYARTDALLDAVSARYVPAGTYGVDDLDHYGNWRVVGEYGPVWVPTGLPAGWAPYTTGSWMFDPFYGWTWVDTAPWGWAPYHYGRWVFIDNVWAWAPGPMVTRPVYAPALVAFFGEPGLQVSVGMGGPVGWVALGWGEPCVPWWGRPGFIHRPWWGGWGGPRVVNNMVIQRTTVVHVDQINVYRNAHVRNAVVVVDGNRFGHGRIGPARVTNMDIGRFRPLHEAPRVAPTPASYVPTASRGIRPPDRDLQRPVVATRPPHRWEGPAAGGERRVGPPGIPEPAPRIVTPPQRREPGAVLSRPPFGQSTIERPAPERPRPPVRQRPEVGRGAERGPEASPTPRQRQAPSQPRPEAKVGAPSAAPQPPAGRPEAPPRPAERGQAPVSRPAAPAAHPEAKVPTPAPRVPAPPAKAPEVSRPTAERGQAPAAQPPETPGRAKQEFKAPSAATRPAAPQARPESRPSAPAPAASERAARPPEASPPRARQLPGEPANRLSPRQSEVGQGQRGEQRRAEPREQNGRGRASREQ